MVHSVAPQEQPKKNSRKELKEQRRLECEAKKKQSTDKKSVIKRHVDHDYIFDTYPGCKKNTSNPLPQSYSPKFVEKCWYDWWIKEGFFEVKNCIKSYVQKRFVIVLPPPNITGKLHLGHALTISLEDSLARYYRMCGYKVLYLPGTDHAGIATQVVVEKRLKRLEGKSRHDYSREEFIEKVWSWKKEYSNQIWSQMKALGCSFDWSKYFFTLDPKISLAVNHSFINLFERGIIYRSEKLVNWSCALSSAISNIEVEKIPINSPTMIFVPGYEKKIEFGVLHIFSYKMCDEDKFINVATTRIETMLGDVAIAVNPLDSRYETIIGKFVEHPFCNRKLEIIADSYVDMDFGTGAVKITPAHDFNDFEMGKRHNLQFLNVINDEGLICGECKDFNGMKRFDARQAIIEKLEALNLYKEKITHEYELPICSRSKDIIEPRMKKQWFLKCSEVSKRAKKSVENGDLKIIPKVYEKTWYHWMENCEDWCISRQLWWGHQIPAYKVVLTSNKNNYDSNEIWIAASNIKEASDKAIITYGLKESDFTLQRDPDVLDTWYSSGLLPFASMGWPNVSSQDYIKYFPNQLLETGSDILFFWVARMVFFSLLLTEKLPFSTVYLHSMVRDAHGRKMSKSLGNVINPFNVIEGITLENLKKTLHDGNLDPREISKAEQGQEKNYPEGIPACGADALRYSLCDFNLSPRDINLDILQIQAKRAFCNKIWNAFYFVNSIIGNDFDFNLDEKNLSSLRRIDFWIINSLLRCIDRCHSGFLNYNFNNVTTSIYEFFMAHFCDVYIECCKIFKSESIKKHTSGIKFTLYLVLNNFLILLHPIMPFITEELYQRLPHPKANENSTSSFSVCKMSYPNSNDFEKYIQPGILKEFDMIFTIIKEVRSAKTLISAVSDCIYISRKNDQHSTTIDIIAKYCDNIESLTKSKIVFGECPVEKSPTTSKELFGLLITFVLSELAHEQTKTVLKSAKSKSDKLIKQKVQLENQISANLSTDHEQNIKNHTKLEKLNADIAFIEQIFQQLNC